MSGIRWSCSLTKRTAQPGREREGIELPFGGFAKRGFAPLLRHVAVVYCRSTTR